MRREFDLELGDVDAPCVHDLLQRRIEPHHVGLAVAVVAFVADAERRVVEHRSILCGNTPQLLASWQSPRPRPRQKFPAIAREKQLLLVVEVWSRFVVKLVACTEEAHSQHRIRVRSDMIVGGVSRVDDLVDGLQCVFEYAQADLFGDSVQRRNRGGLSVRHDASIGE